MDAQSHMKCGLLWFDDNRKRTLAAKVERAARRYRRKFGRSPDVCYVHPVTSSAAQSMPECIELVESESIPPHHFWIGVRSGSTRPGAGHSDLPVLS